MSVQENPLDRSIVEAAQLLLSEVGEGFTMEQLESKTAVSRATIYRRVGNKAELLARLARERGESFEKSDMKLSILSAARRVFSCEGLAAATMEQVAAEAGVGVATVYRHFGDKEGLVQAFIDKMTPRTAVRELVMHPSDDVRADLEKIVDATLKFFHENRDVLRLVFMGSETERRYLDGLRARSDSSLSRLTDYFAAQHQAGRLAATATAEELALGLIGIMVAFAVFGPLHYGTTFRYDQQSVELIVDMFLTDLRTEKRGN